jgi:hypothetical protein
MFSEMLSGIWSKEQDIHAPFAKLTYDFNILPEAAVAPDRTNNSDYCSAATVCKKHTFPIIFTHIWFIVRYRYTTPELLLNGYVPNFFTSV